MSDTHMIDLAFTVQGGPIDREYASALREAVAPVLPWLDAEPGAGIHPLRGTTLVDGCLCVGARTRLVLRVPQARVADCAALEGRSLGLREPLLVGHGRTRELLPHRTLYCPLVVTGDEAEEAFLAAVQASVASLQIACQVIVGRAGSRRIAAGARRGFSVMLHGVNAESSLRAQEEGVGEYRMFGCGLFVPHRSADAVGT
jgi:CRISPR-associated protein Cas6